MPAFRTTETPPDLRPERFPVAPPELLLERTLSPAGDVWCLAALLADLAAATPEFTTLLGGNAGPPLERLCHAARLLGPLPAGMVGMCPLSDRAAMEQAGARWTADALWTAGHEGSAPAPQGAPEDEAEEPVEGFSEAELRLLVDLLRGMLAYEPERRLTAHEALAHVFFAMERPV